MAREDWIEVSPRKWLNNKTHETIIRDLNYLEVGKRYLLQWSTGYPGGEWINPIEETTVLEKDSVGGYIKLSSRGWTPIITTWSVKVLSVSIHAPA